MINTNENNENQDSFVLDLNEVAFTLHNILTWNLYNKLCLSRITYSNLDQTIGIVAKSVDSDKKGTYYFSTKYEEGKFTQNFDSRLNVIGHTPLTPEIVKIGLENINIPGHKQKITVIPLHDSLRDKQIVKLAGLEKFCSRKTRDLEKLELAWLAIDTILESL